MQLSRSTQTQSNQDREPAQHGDVISAKQRSVEQRLRDAASERARVERTRREALLAEAAAWQQASFLRAYLTYLESMIASGVQPAPDYPAWREWALDVASSLDPSEQHLQR